MLEATQVSFSYGGRQVLKEINLRVKQGEIMAFLGPNGSGLLNRPCHPDLIKKNCKGNFYHDNKKISH